MRLIRLFIAVALVVSPIGTVAAAPPPTVASDALSLLSTFTISSPTEVPGETLRPGTYSLRVVDHLSDRIVLRIEGPAGKLHTSFLGLENSGIRTSKATGAILWPAGVNGEGAMRGFAFPGGGVVEFVYPKAEAVQIAKVNASKVAAIDPASEGRTPDKGLSKDDMQMVTLWMLSSTRVGPGDATEPAIKAERYQAPSTGSDDAASAAQQGAGDTKIGAGQRARAQRVAKLNRPPIVASLPHTASELPLILFAGLLALLSGVALRLIIRAGNVA